MDLLDMGNIIIKEKKFEGTNRPFEKQEVCVIPIVLPKLETQCEECVFCDVCSTRGKVDELGIGGYASNQADTKVKTEGSVTGNVMVGIKPIKNDPTIRVTLRRPRAIIMADGQMWICRNPMRKASTCFLRKDEVPCGDFKRKIKPKV